MKILYQKHILYKDMTIYPNIIRDLPITDHLDSICEQLKTSPSRFLILTAETGAGKSTAVPIALLNHFKGKILMLEPRRLAAIAVANRVSEILEEKPGQTAGYVMHMERKTSGSTRFTVITEAILTNMLLKDPSLEDINVVVIDEFHERSVHADLGLCFLKEAMELNENLYVIVMSATLNAERIADYLGQTGESTHLPVPVCKVPGRTFPVSIEYKENKSPSQAVLDELFADKKNTAKGTILVFLPGIAAIRKTETELKQALLNSTGTSGKNITDILILHSSVSFEEQKKILTAQKTDDPRRVILSSAIAETSVTVPDVTVVIDSGWMRVNRMNVTSGMETLVTERVSAFSAAQRTGRAGRTQAGRCVRLWNKNEVLVEQTPPEILRTDLLSVVLQCAEWGIRDKSSLNLLDSPSDNAWNTAAGLLEQMKCLNGEKYITNLGKAALVIGLSPRLSCVVLKGTPQDALPYTQYSKSSFDQQKKFIAECQNRKNRCQSLYPDVTKSFAEPLLAGFPDRLARKCSTKENKDLISGTQYQFPSGRKAVISDKTKTDSQMMQWIIAPEVNAGERTGIIYQYKDADEAVVSEFLQKHTQTKTVTEFADDSSSAIRKKRVLCYGKIILSEKSMPVSEEDYAQALCTRIQDKGIDILPLSKTCLNFLLRASFYKKKSLEEVKSFLAQNVNEWLVPFITGRNISEQTVLDAVKYFLNGQEIDNLVPEIITLANGKKARIVYEQTSDSTSGQKIRPTIEIIIQQMFGCFETPEIMGVHVLLKLLSPARRPLQITDDLEGFWSGTWNDICKEMKGRYPKHNWNYKISE